MYITQGIVFMWRDVPQTSTSWLKSSASSPAPSMVCNTLCAGFQAQPTEVNEEMRVFLMETLGKQSEPF